MYKILISFMAITLVTLGAFASQEEPEFHGIQGGNSLYATKENDKYYLYHGSDGRYISRQAYDMIYGCYAYSNCENKVVVVRLGNRFGLVDTENGKEISEIKMGKIS